MFPSGLSMLWESVEAPDAFTSRFGFADFDDGADWLASTLQQHWALPVLHCERIVLSDQNAIAWITTALHPEGLICKWSRDESAFARLAATTGLLTTLGERGIPVAAPLLTREARARELVTGPLGPLSLCVQPVIAGAPLDLGDDAAVRESGVQLARLHRAMADLADSPAKSVAGRPELDLPARVESWLAGSTRFSGYDDALRRDLVALPPLGAQPQLVHNDYRSANLVTNGSAITGILDFDEISWDYRVSDLAHTGVYLGTLFREWGPTPPAARELLVEGYEVEGYEAEQPLTDSERRWLGFLTRFFSVAAGWPLVPEATE
jgi:homoserine kinase type II